MPGAPVLLILSAAVATVPVVRIGGLFPRFRTVASSYSHDSSGVRRYTAFVQAIREINDKSDGVADDLLPNTQLRFTTRDSKRSEAHAYDGARKLAQLAFDGTGVSAVVGAASSGPSKLAALALAQTSTPQISYSSTSAALSDGSTYPYFLRTPPSDAFQARGLADLAKNLLGYSRLAVVVGRDSYSTAGNAAFLAAAAELGITIIARVQIAPSAAGLSQQYKTLRQSAARVVVLFCSSYDASRFLDGALEEGIGGPGWMWLASDAVANANTFSRVADPARRERIFKGLFALSPSIGRGTPAYSSYLARLKALQPTLANGVQCDTEVDDDGELMWAFDHDDDASTPLECSGSDNQAEDTYAPFAYDAVFALAKALHVLIEEYRVSAILGDELMAALTQNVSFVGVTGQIEFQDASGHPERHLHGDRIGSVYDVRTEQHPRPIPPNASLTLRMHFESRF